ncbi:MAG TPA: hypothetical protein VJJ81_02080 [Candidatus Babeliales bacterium]|nr:hypothetical protein [Candidatus Babeliales bacterium]
MQFWRFDTQKFVALHLDDQNLTCVCLTGKYPDVQILGQQSFKLDPKIVHELVVYNPTVFKNYIASFSEQHNLGFAKWGLILDHSIIIENLNSINHQLVEHKFSRINLNGNTDSPDSSVPNWFYTAHIPVGITWQYQLGFIKQRLNLMGITTHNGALLGLLKRPEFKITANLHNLVVSNQPVLNLGTNLNLVKQDLIAQQIWLACLGLYISWGAD